MTTGFQGQKILSGRYQRWKLFGLSRTGVLFSKLGFRKNNVGYVRPSSQNQSTNDCFEKHRYLQIRNNHETTETTDIKD